MYRKSKRRECYSRLLLLLIAFQNRIEKLQDELLLFLGQSFDTPETFFPATEFLSRYVGGKQKMFYSQVITIYKPKLIG